MGVPPVKADAKLPKAQHKFKDPAIVPPDIRQALRQAMALERMPADWLDDMLWILAQESEGNIGITNRKGSSARGLFQLTRANYGLMPRGEASFGNAVEECQGGVRYVVGRYHTAAAARAFWVKHLWY